MRLKKPYTHQLTMLVEDELTTRADSNGVLPKTALEETRSKVIDTFINDSQFLGQYLPSLIEAGIGKRLDQEIHGRVGSWGAGPLALTGSPKYERQRKASLLRQKAWRLAREKVKGMPSKERVLEIEQELKAQQKEGE